jgi:hypothetical protein
MHELGHSLGLEPEDYRGIDSKSISFSNYPSVMNYNRPWEFYGYSNGNNSQSDFNDWGHIESDMYTPGTIELSTDGD